MTRGYPTFEEVERAGIYALTSWMRFLPSPDDEARPILDLIMERYKDVKASDRAAAIQASKDVGWVR